MKIATRQRIRRGLILGSMLLFPLIMNYFSPYIIIDGASQGILNASPILFGLMFISALFLGRLWCGWACPAAGFGEVCQAINDRPVNGKKIDWIKWAIWFPWLGIVIWAVINAGGYQRVDFFHLIDNGISVNQPVAYIMYYLVVGLFVGLAVVVGRRAGCHTICWMAPFMILGRKLRNLGGWPSLRLEAHADECRGCKRCTTHCPMSLDVNNMVKVENMEHSECVLCGNCVDNCPEKAIRYVFNATPRKQTIPMSIKPQV